jgi:hypothetical protein
MRLFIGFIGDQSLPRDQKGEAQQKRKFHRKEAQVVTYAFS